MQIPEDLVSEHFPWGGPGNEPFKTAVTNLLDVPDHQLATSVLKGPSPSPMIVLLMNM